MESHDPKPFHGRSRFAALVLASTLVGGCFIFQGGSGDLELDTPTANVTLALDKAEYGLGEAVIATVEIENQGKTDAVLAVPGKAICEFYARAMGGSADALQQLEFVASPDENTSFDLVPAGEKFSRKLVLPRFTSKPGKYEVFVRYRTEEQAISTATEDVSDPVTITIGENVVFERDREGRLTDAEAARVSREHWKAAADAKVDTLLAKDELRLDVWLTTLHRTNAEGTPETKSLLISPYTGKIKREVDTTVAAEKARSR